MMFLNREDAGRQLAQRLLDRRGRNQIVLGLTRGGVPVAAEVARVLECPLDVVVVRKLGAPGRPELAIGAIAEGGEVLLNDALIVALHCELSYLDEVMKEQTEVLNRRVEQFRTNRAPLEIAGADVVIIDDGLATGFTARVACRFARNNGAKSVLLAVPVASPEAMEAVIEADEVISLATPASFYAVGAHYEDFTQVSDDQVRALLEESDKRTLSPQREKP
jgi:putative phosphoribosyl transferase